MSGTFICPASNQPCVPKCEGGMLEVCYADSIQSDPSRFLRDLNEARADVERLTAKVARVEAVSPYNEDGYCHWCGNGSWKAGHALECEWADALADEATR